MFSEIEKQYSVSIFSPEELKKLHSFPDNKSRVFAFVNSIQLERLCASHGVYNFLRCSSETLGEAERSSISKLLEVVKTFGFEEYYQINKSNFVMSSNKESIPMLKNYGSVLNELLKAFKEGDGGKASKILKVHINKLLELSSQLGDFMDVADNKTISMARLQQVVNELNTLRESYASLQSKLEENKRIAISEINTTKASLNKTVGELNLAKTKINQLNSDLESRNKELSDVNEEFFKVNQTVQEYSNQITTLQQQHNNDLETIKQQHSNDLEALQQQHNSDLEALKQRHHEELERLEVNHKEDLLNAETEYNTKLNEAEATLKSEIDHLETALRESKDKIEKMKEEAEHSNVSILQENQLLLEQVTTLKTEIETIRLKSKRDLDEMQKEYESQIEELQETFTVEKEKLINSHALEIDSLQMQYQSEINKIRQEYQNEEPEISAEFIEPKNNSEELEALREKYAESNNRVAELEGELNETLTSNVLMESNLQKLITKVETLQTQVTVIQTDTEQSVNSKWEKIFNAKLNRVIDDYETKIRDLEVQLELKAKSSGNDTELKQMYNDALSDMKSNYEVQIAMLEQENNSLTEENAVLHNQLDGWKEIQNVTVTAQSSEQEVKIIELKSKLSTTLRELQQKNKIIEEFNQSDTYQQLQRERAKTEQLQEIITQLRNKIPVASEKLPLLTNKDIVKCPVLYFKDVCQSPLVVSIINYVLEFVQTQTSIGLKDISIVIYDNANPLNILQFKKTKVPVQYYSTGDALRNNTSIYHTSSMNKELLTKLDYNSKRLLVIVDRLCGHEDAVVVKDMEELFLVDSTSDLDSISKVYLMKLNDFKKKCIMLSSADKTEDYLGVVGLPNNNSSVTHMELRFLSKLLDSLLD